MLFYIIVDTTLALATAAVSYLYFKILNRERLREDTLYMSVSNVPSGKASAKK